MKMFERDLLRVGVVGLAIVAGCAGQQTKRSSGLGEDESTSAGGSSADPLADVGRPPPGKTDRKIEAEAQEDFDKAVAKYQKLKKGGSLKPGDCGDAIDAFADVEKDHPSLPEAKFNHGAVLLECGKESEAVRIFEQMAEGPKPYSPAVTNLAFLAAKAGDVDKASTMFRRAIELDQQINSVAARLNLALILRDGARRTSDRAQKAKLNDEAQSELRKVLALDGSNLKAYAGLAFLYYDIGLLDAAVLVGDQAIMKAEEIATGKTSEQLQEEFGAAKPAAKKNKKGKGEKADAESESESPKAKAETGAGTGYTAELKKQLAVVYNTLGMVELKKKNVSRAIKQFKLAVDNDPELFEARLNWAALALNFRDYASAEQNLRAVLAAQPKNYEAKVSLGVALRGQRKVEDAEKEYLSAMQLAPNRPEAYFNLGVLFQEYKGTDRVALEKAQQYFRDYISHQGPKQREASTRIKNIDDTFAALVEAEKMQKEAEEMQRQAEEQQKKAEEEAKKNGGVPAEEAPPPAPGAPGTSAEPAPGPARSAAK